MAKTKQPSLNCACGRQINLLKLIPRQLPNVNLKRLLKNPVVFRVNQSEPMVAINPRIPYKVVHNPNQINWSQ